MNRNEIVWILECCILTYDGINKNQLLEYGCPEELAEMGIKLSQFLKNKSSVVCV